MAGTFKAGSFQFPTGAGDFSVTGLGIEPQGIIFFGGNQAVEDTLLTPAAPGVFFGMAWLDVDSGLVDFEANSITTMGWRFRQKPILCLSSNTTVEYEASNVTFDADGFTITVATAAPGARLVHYLAWGGFDGAEGKSFGSTAQGTQFNVTGLGYRPLSSLMFSLFAALATRDDSVDGVVYHTMGTANFPGTNTNTSVTNTNGTAISFYWQIPNANGYTQQNLGSSIDGIALSVEPGPVQTWRSDLDHLRPYPNWTDDSLRLTLFGYPNRAQLVWWNCEGSVHTVDTPNVAATQTITAQPNVEQVQAALFFSTTGYGSEAIDLVNAAYVFGVLTDDYQGVVAFDTGIGPSPADGTASFFQSQNACFANSLSPSGGIRVASGQINGNQVILTGETASNAEIAAGLMQVWGGRQLSWVPQMYRWWPERRGM